MKVLVGFLLIGLMVVGLLYMQGFFDSGKVGPGTEVRAADKAGEVETVAVLDREMPVTSEAIEADLLLIDSGESTDDPGDAQDRHQDAPPSASEDVPPSVSQE